MITSETLCYTEKCQLCSLYSIYPALFIICCHGSASVGDGCQSSSDVFQTDSQSQIKWIYMRRCYNPNVVSFSHSCYGSDHQLQPAPLQPKQTTLIKMCRKTSVCTTAPDLMWIELPLLLCSELEHSRTEDAPTPRRLPHIVKKPTTPFQLVRTEEAALDERQNVFWELEKNVQLPTIQHLEVPFYSITFPGFTVFTFSLANSW